VCAPLCRGTLEWMDWEESPYRTCSRAVKTMSTVLLIQELVRVGVLHDDDVARGLPLDIAIEPTSTCYRNPPWHLLSRVEQSQCRPGPGLPAQVAYRRARRQVPRRVDSRMEISSPHHSTASRSVGPSTSVICGSAARPVSRSR
jgi:hypothetical protein